MSSPVPEPKKQWQLGGYTQSDVASAFLFDKRALLFAARTTTAAMLALLLGSALGFHDAYWAAVTAWVLAVPGRGMVMSKALYRILGTTAGAAVAFLMLPLSREPALFVAGLSLWCGACAVIASVFRRFQAYAAQMAGFTATIVGVVSWQHPSENPYDMALQRVVLVLVGIVSSTLLAFLFAEKITEKEVQLQARGWASKACLWAAQLVYAPDQHADDAAPNRELWTGLSEFEAFCAYAAVESALNRQRLPAIRRLTATELSLVSSARSLRRFVSMANFPGLEQLPQQLERVAALYLEGADPSAEIALIRDAVGPLSMRATQGEIELAPQLVSDRLRQVADALERIAADLRFVAEPAPLFSFAPPPAVHRDWFVSLGIGVRVMLATFAIGLWWTKFHWPGGAYAFIFTSVACVVFGVQAQPRAGLRRFAFGLCVSVLVFGLWHALPRAIALAPGPTIIAVICCTFVCAVALSRRFAPAMDFNTNFTSLMLGGGHTIVGFKPAVASSLGLMLGIGFAYLAFSIPTMTAAWREQHLHAELLGALRKLAASHGKPKPHRWETKMYDFMSQSAAAGSAAPSARSLRRGLLALDMGLEILRLRTLLPSLLQGGKGSGVLAQDIRGFLSKIVAGMSVEELAPEAHQQAASAFALALADTDQQLRSMMLQTCGAFESIARCSEAWSTTPEKLPRRSVRPPAM